MKDLEHALAMTRSLREDASRTIIEDSISEKIDRPVNLDVNGALGKGVSEVLQNNAFFFLMQALHDMQEPEAKLRPIQSAVESLLTIGTLSGVEFVEAVEALGKSNLLALAYEFARKNYADADFLISEWREIVVFVAERPPFEGDDKSPMVKFLFALRKKSSGADQKILEDLIVRFNGQTDFKGVDAYVATKTMYLVVEVKGDDHDKDLFAFSASLWRENQLVTQAPLPENGFVDGLSKSELLTRIGAWLNDFFVDSEGTHFVEFLVPGALLHQGFPDVHLCETGQGTDMERISWHRPWSIRPSDFLKNGVRKQNLELRWAEPSIVQELIWLAAAPEGYRPLYDKFAVQRQGVPPLRCVAYGFDLTDHDEDIVLHVSRAGIPATIWFRSSGQDLSAFRQALADSLIGKPLAHLPQVLLDIRQAAKDKGETALENAVLLLDHYYRTMPKRPPLPGVA